MLQEEEIFLPGSQCIECVCLQAPRVPASFPALLGACGAQPSSAFGCSGLAPAQATVVEWGAFAQPRSLLLHPFPQPLH